MQAFLFVFAKREVMVPGVINEDCGNSDKNRGVTKAMYRIEGCEHVEIFRNGSVHKFYRLKALITLEQVITSVVEKKNNLNEQNFDGEDNWSVVISFHCMQVSLLMSMLALHIKKKITG